MPSPPGRVLCVPSSPLNKERSPCSVQTQPSLLSLQPSHAFDTHCHLWLPSEAARERSFRKIILWLPKKTEEGWLG